MTVSAEGADRISLLYEAARVHGSLVSINDLALLMPEDASEAEIEEAIRLHPSLSSRFALESGYVVEKVGLDPRLALADEMRSRARASTNLLHAARFAPLLTSSGFEMVGVSGSTSYRSASRSVDVDLFCVSPGSELWISLTRALLFSRVFALLNPTAPPFCLSCVMDEDYARATFSAEQGALFARDALQTVVLAGDPTYRSLLRSSRWISKIYPAAFAQRASPEMEPVRPRSRGSAWKRALNTFLFILAGGYIRAKSSLLNRRFAAAGQLDSVFALRMDEDHLVYESSRYKTLRNGYATVSIPRTISTERSERTH